MNRMRGFRVGLPLIPALVAISVIAAILSACGGGGAPSPTSSYDTRSASNVANVTTLVGNAFDIASSAGQYISRGRSRTRSQCPEIAYEYDEERLVHVVTEHYDGCTDEDGFEHSGTIKVEIYYDEETQICTVFYQDYEWEGQGKMNGTVIFRLPDRNSLNYTIESHYEVEVAEGCVLTVQSEGTLIAPTPDATFGIFNGRGTLTIGTTVAEFVMEDVETEEDCAYPISGTSTLTFDGKTTTLTYKQPCGQAQLSMEGSQPTLVDLARLLETFNPCRN